jgi:hypothetical protein
MQRWHHAAAASLLAAAALAPALRNGFVNWDDRAAIVDNPALRGLTWEHLRWMARAFHLGHWQPLSWLSLALDFSLWGPRPFGVHLTALLLHALNAALACLLAARLLRAAGLPPPRAAAAAFWTAALFAVHPLRVESVAWATERRDVLSGAFALGALLVHASEAPARRRAAAVALLCAGAFASNVRLIWLPAALVLLALYPLRRAAKPALLEAAPPAALALGAALAGMAAQAADPALVPLSRFGVTARLAQCSFALGFYLSKLALPVGLSPLYERSLSLDPGEFAAYALLFALAVSLAWRARKRQPGALAALAFYTLALAPSLGLVKSGRQTAADRYTYLASLGPCALAGAWLSASPRRRGAGAAAVLALTLVTWRQCSYWRDSAALWSRAVACDPRGFFARRNLAAALLEAGRPAEAAVEAQRAEAAYRAIFPSAR